MSTLHFNKSARKNANGENEIMVRFFHNSINQRAKTNIFFNDTLPGKKLGVWETYWDETAQRFDKKKIDAIRLNADDIKGKLNGINKKLDDLSEAINEAFIATGAATVKGLTVDADWLKSVIIKFNDFPVAETTEISEEELQRLERQRKHDEFINAFDEYPKEKKLSAGRTRHFMVLKHQLVRFELYRKITKKDFYLSFDTVDAETLKDFDWFLEHEHELVEKPQYKKLIKDETVRGVFERGNNRRVVILKKVRAVFSWANGKDNPKPLTTNDPFSSGYKIGAEKYVAHPYFPTIDERKQLEDYDFGEDTTLALERDIFVFQCCIGCRVSDLWSMTKTSVVERGGGRFVEYIPRKTKDGHPVVVSVPLNDTAKKILERYPDDYADGKLFPFFTQQAYNRDIKKIFKDAGLDRVVTIMNSVTGKEEKRHLYEVASSHMARRCFVGNLYRKVQDPSLIAPLSGHVEGSKAFARYRDIDDDLKQQTISLLD